MDSQPPAPAQPEPQPVPYADGRLHARPDLLRQIAHQRQPALNAGTHQLSFADGRKAVLHVPPHLDSGAGAHGAGLHLLLLLHGAAGQHGGGDHIALAHAIRHGSLLLIPDALSSSWDFLRGGFGADLAFIDRALLWTMQRYEVDEQAMAIAGFSDGASYALSVGLMNGHLFSDILAFSPGFMAPLRREGQPRVFVSHGKEDQVLSVKRGHDIAQQLAQEGYDVTYEAFDGAHIVSPPIARAALHRLTE
ncbi:MULTISPECIES: alpha/beta hydrolase [unclassified Duganella]|uniref:alpha/beta hydrolase n=1 Tax=unclassified Duganella TaxID=2636909 RepID=UPI00088B5A2F|nr:MULTISPECIES: thioesterase [unclassified Duganella]SDF93798.1 Predicted esterase [Duganella sp. OV458]SDJ10975.1 Predicted esterase [Duganella sp. OV510]